MEQIKTFISYAHDDDPFFKDFVSRLKKAVKNSEHFTWDIWDDRDIYVGTFWDEAIQEKIQDCNIAILLVSMSFMASKYIKENEFENLKQRYAEKGVLIVPILFAPCDFQRWEDLGKIQFFKPKGSDYGKPEIEHFTYADLLTFKTDGTILPTPNADRYVLALVKKIELSYREFSEQQKLKILEEEIVIDIAQTDTVNKLSDAPKPRPYFTGRDKEIEDFKAAIDNGTTFIAVDGPGGIGKTQFISRCIERFVPTDKVIWYECTAASHLDTLISESGYPELLKGASKTDREKFNAFKDKIQKNELFLFLDNFQDTNNNPAFKEFLVFIQDYLKKGCVVVIDRDDIRSTDLIPKRIHIEGFKEKQLEYARAVIAHSYPEIINITDEELIRLCVQLHGYPFAIDLAILLLSRGESSADILSKIVQLENNEKVSERLLNAIFSRPDVLPEEQEFITNFSIFTNKVSENDIRIIIPESIINAAKIRLQQKNLLIYTGGYFEVHPLVREFCYEKIQDKDALHAKVADYYISQRTDILNPSLEEQIFYHLSQSKQWEKIDKEIEEKGRKFILQGQLGLVKELLERLIKIGVTNPIFSIFVGDIATIQGNRDLARDSYNKARYNDTNEEIKVEGIIKYGEIFYALGDPMEALKYYEHAYNLTGNTLLKAKVRAAHNIGLVHAWLGDKKLASMHFNEALNLSREVNDRELEATILMRQGDILYDKGDYDNALRLQKDALAIFISIDDKRGIASSIMAIGRIYSKKKKYHNAIKNYENSLAISEKVGDRLGIANALLLKGTVLYDIDKLDEVLKQYEICNKIAEEIGDKQLKAAVLNNIALVYDKQHKYPKAIDLYKQSLIIKEEIHDIAGVGGTHLNLGALYVEHIPVDYYSAISSLFIAVSIFNKISNKADFANGIAWLIQIRDNIGLNKFKEIANKVLYNFDSDLQKYLPLKELVKEPIINTEVKIGRNESCPCGSGKKYKQCHGKGIS